MDVRTKVLYITYDGLTDPLGGSQILPYIIGLSSTHDFTILSCEKKDRFLKFNGSIRRLCKQHNIRWEHIFFKRTPPIIAKYIDLFQLKQKAIALCKSEKFDLIHCRSYISIEVGLLLKKKFGSKVLFDMRGFWVDERVEGGLWNLHNPIYKLAYQVYKKKEARFIKDSDHIVILTEVGKKEIQTWPSLNNSIPITVIPCMVDFNTFSQNGISKSEAKKNLGFKEDDFVVSYLGSMGTWYLLDEMLSFFIEVKKCYSTAKFLMVTPDLPEDILMQVQKKGLLPGDFKILFAPREKVPEKIKASDISLVFIKKCYSKKASSPTKLGELMALGIPVVCNEGIGDVNDIIEKSKGGLLLPEFSVDEYHKIIRQFPKVLSLSSTEISDSIKPYFDLVDGIKSYRLVYNRVLNQ